MHNELSVWGKAFRVEISKYDDLHSRAVEDAGRLIARTVRDAGPDGPAPN
jgi:hypothetical protein